MRYVNPTPDALAQNLVACQNGLEIYFYTLKPIVTGAELLVWYSHEFAESLQCPLPGELGEERPGRGLGVAGVPPYLRCTADPERVWLQWGRGGVMPGGCAPKEGVACGVVHVCPPSCTCLGLRRTPAS